MCHCYSVINILYSLHNACSTGWDTHLVWVCLDRHTSNSPSSITTASNKAWKLSTRLVRLPYLGGRRSLPSSTTNPSVRDHSLLGWTGSSEGGRGGRGGGDKCEGGEVRRHGWMLWGRRDDEAWSVTRRGEETWVKVVEKETGVREDRWRRHGV